jgi:hypothetical protein
MDSQAISQVCFARTAGGVLPAALVKTAILVAATWRVGFGLGVPQQHQTAHRAISIRSVESWI